MLGMALEISVVNEQVLALDPAVTAQALVEDFFDRRILEVAKRADPAGVPCAHERRAKLAAPRLATMNSRRFIRSSSQLEGDRTQYHVSIVVGLTAGANAASQMPHVAQDSILNAPQRDVRFAPHHRHRQRGGALPISARSLVSASDHHVGAR